MSTTMMDKVVEHLESFSDDLLMQVLNFVENLDTPSKSQKGTPGTVLLQFAGGISPEGVQQMQAAIEAGCEQVDLNEW